MFQSPTRRSDLFSMSGEKQKWEAVYYGRMKRQIGSRLGLARVQDVLKQVCDQTVSVEQACESLGIGKSRLYTLRSEYLKVRGKGRAQTWRPGVSGGNHAVPWD